MKNKVQNKMHNFNKIKKSNKQNMQNKIIIIIKKMLSLKKFQKIKMFRTRFSNISYSTTEKRKNSKMKESEKF